MLKKMLLIMENKAKSLEYRENLEKMGYEVIEEKNSIAGYDRVRKNGISVVVIEVKFISIEGKEFISLLKELFRKIQVIVTGDYSPELLEGMADGADGYIPFSHPADMLVRKIAELSG